MLHGTTFDSVFVAYSTIITRGGGKALKSVLIVKDKKLNDRQRAVVNNAVRGAGKIAERLNVNVSNMTNFNALPHEDIDLRNFVRSVIENVYINDPNQIVPGTEYPYRELLGLDKKNCKLWKAPTLII